MLDLSLFQGLYGIVDDGVRPDRSLASKLDALLDGGCTVVQLRLKSATSRQLYEAACAARARMGGRALLLVNDRLDVALAARADGVHLGADDLPAAQARRLGGERLIVGATVRTLEQARAARLDGADYVGFGPVFATSTKHIADPVRGVDRLREVAESAGLPVVAIGGLTAERMFDVARAGARAGAVVSGVLAADSMCEAAREMQRRFQDGRRAGRALDF